MKREPIMVGFWFIVLALLVVYALSGCCAGACLALKTARVDFPRCSVEEDGEWDGEILVRIRCPKEAPFVASYEVYPAHVARKR